MGNIRESPETCVHKKPGKMYTAFFCVLCLNVLFFLFSYFFYVFGPSASRILCLGTWVGSSSMRVKYKTTHRITLYTPCSRGIIFTPFIHECECLCEIPFLSFPSPGFEKLNNDIFSFGIHIYARVYTRLYEFRTFWRGTLENLCLMSGRRVENRFIQESGYKMLLNYIP